MNYYEREEDAIIEAYNKGEITNSQMQSELNELRRDMRQAAEAAASEAYDREMERW